MLRETKIVDAVRPLEAGKGFNEPILLLIYNRPDLTRRVIGRVKAVKPREIYIAADGPSASKDADFERCKEARRVAIDSIDWECKVTTLFRDSNLGCGMGVSDGISWFFSHVDQGIILEDDLDPDPTFFNFASYLLDQYRNKESVMHISGNNFQVDGKRSNSYYFSNYPHCWGWATWKDRWQKFELNPTLSRAQLSHFVERKVNSAEEANFWEDVFYSTFIEGRVDSWAYSWHFAIWRNDGVSILPYKNLVVNNGFGSDATHTKDAIPGYSRIGRQAIDGPIETHEMQQVSHKYDINTFETFFAPRPGLFKRLKKFLTPKRHKLSFHSRNGK